MSIAFICSANLCRSQMAHAICVARSSELALDIQVFSGGVFDFSGQHIVESAWMVCCKNRTPPIKNTSTFIRDLPIKEIDHFFVMEYAHSKILIEEYGVCSDSVSLLGTYDQQKNSAEIQDPMGSPMIAFEECYRRIATCVSHLLLNSNIKK